MDLVQHVEFASQGYRNRPLGGMGNSDCKQRRVEQIEFEVYLSYIKLETETDGVEGLELSVSWGKERCVGIP